MDLRGQETVYFTLALELRGKLSSGYLGMLVEDLGLPSGSWYLIGVGFHRVSLWYNVVCIRI